MFWFLCISAAVLVFVYVLLEILKNEDFEKIPGPKGLPIVENSLDFLMNPVKLIYHFRMLSNKYKRMFKLKLASKRFVVLGHPEDVEALISSTKHSAKGFLYEFIEPWLKQGLLLSDGQKWFKRRKILTPTFHFNILRHFHPILEEKSWSFADSMQKEVDQPKTEIMKYVTEFTLNSICETAMGTKLDEKATSFGRKYKDGILKLGEYVVYRAQRVWLYPNIVYLLTKIGRQQRNTLNLLSSFRDSVINKRRETFEDVSTILDDEKIDNISIGKGKKRFAMLDLLLRAEKDGLIDAQGIGEEVDTFMFEGHDTTATALQFTFMLLANHQEAQDKIVKECEEIFSDPTRAITMVDLTGMKYMECCIKESMRLYPPVHFIVRSLKQPLLLKDHKLPANTDCTILIFDLHRRSDQYTEPLQFRPERFLVEPTWHPYAYIPFSAGPRNCIGQKFAMMEMKLAVASVLRRYRLLPVTKMEDIIITTDFILRPKDPIYVKITNRY